MCCSGLKNCYLMLCTWGGMSLPWIIKSCGSFSSKADNTLRWALPSKKCLFYGGGFVPSLQSVFLLWSQRTRTVLFFAIMCCSGTCLQPRLIRHEWGTSFFDVGASLKNCSHRLKKTKPCRSFEPKVDKLLAGLE